MISVCLATYNGAPYIKEQITSVLNQLLENDELLIADDGSTDNTITIIESIHDSRLRIVGVGGKLGVVKNFERVLTEAKGQYVFLCDQDDIWLPNKVEECLQALKKNILVVTDCKVVDKSLNEISPSFFELRNSGKGILKNIWKNTYLGCCMAFRRELLNIGLPIPAKIPMHDMWLGLLAETQGTVLFLPQNLSLYRRHHLAVSPTAGKSNLSIFKKLYIRVVLVACILNRLCSHKFKKIIKSI